MLINSPKLNVRRHKRAEINVQFPALNSDLEELCVHTETQTCMSDLGRKVRFQVIPEQSIFQILVLNLRLLLEESLSFSPFKGRSRLF